MADAEADFEAPEAATKKEKKPLHKRITLSLSAFIMSVTMTMINVYYSLRGPEVAVQAPDHILLYRDGEGDQAVLNFGVRLAMINTASDYGDLLLGATLQPSSGVSLKYQSLIQPVFTAQAEQAAKGCNLESRCLPYNGLLVVERQDEIIDIPGGAARSHYFSFTAAQWNCTGAEKACAGYKDYRTAASQLSHGPVDLTITLRFNGDGERRIRCRTGQIDLRYLEQLGWMNIPCETSSVSDRKLI